MRTSGVLLIYLLLHVATANALVLPPSEPLTSSEQLELGVIRAEAIVIGKARRITRGTAPNPAGPGYIENNYVTVAVKRWLKGGGSPDTIRVGFWSDAISRVKSKGPHAKQHAIWFLYPTPRPKPTSDGMWPYPITPEWMALESTDMPGGGFTYLAPESEAQLELQIESIRASHDIAALAKRASVVVLGVVEQSNHSKTRAGISQRYAALRILEDIAGDLNKSSVFVRHKGLHSAFEVGDTLVAFLTPESGTEYEIIGLGAGAKHVSKGHMKASGKHLFEAIAEIKAAKRGIR